jgi:Ca2+-binding RTX toxin-like protein
LNGGAGVADMADYIQVTSNGITVALDTSFEGTGDAQGDTFTGIERLRGTNLADCLKGNAFANTMFGLNGGDALDGGGGADRLIGGAGTDTLTGGTGADRFEFAAANEIGDIVLDFSAVDDVFAITASAFGGGLVAGTLSASLFQTSTDNIAAGSIIRFVFNTSNKTLWFDADGNGAASAIMVAELQATASMTNADILIV